MTKSPTRIWLREQKAEALDIFVKAELARKKTFDGAKIARLKALRLVRDEQEANAAASREPAAGGAITRKTMHLPRSS